MTSYPMKIEPETNDNDMPSWTQNASLWDVQTVYLFQYFNCPECLFKVQEKQLFINHACESHPDSIGYFNNIKDGSLEDVIVPYIITGDVYPQVKVEVEDDEDEEEDTKVDIEDHNFDSSDEFEEPSIKKPKKIKRKADDDVQCYCCGITTKFRDIKKHISDQHGSYAVKANLYGDPQPFECFKCKGTFESQGKLDQHICYDVKVPDKNPETKTFECTECQTPWQGAVHYRQHWFSVHTEVKSFKCTFSETCEFKGKTTYDVRQHVRKKHQEVEATILCPQCGKAFTRESSMKHHVKLIHDKKSPGSMIKNQKPKNVPCKECPRVFTSYSKLKQHYEHHHQLEKLIKCDTCDLTFVTLEEWDSHIKKCHLAEMKHPGDFQCELCRASFCIAKLLDLHHSIVHKKKMFTCELCKKSYSESSNLRKHEKREHQGGPAEKRKANCPFCEDWSGEGTLRDHVKDVHPDEPLPFLCDKCDYKTFSKSNLSIHIKYMHNKNTDFMCDRCDYVTKTQCKLQIHIDKVHLGIKNFSCDQCPKAFKDKRALHRHLVTAHQVVLEDKDMENVLKEINRAATVKVVEPKCDKCTESFSTEFMLDDHYTRVHESDAKIKCIHCDSFWHSAQSLNYHIYNSHKANDRNCDICGIFLKNSYYLERHKKKVHFKIHDFVCEHCGKSFPCKINRDMHINVVHLKEPKFPCDKCDFKALTKPKLSLHIRTKHMINDFKCRFCDFVTSSPKTLQTHGRNIHASEKKPGPKLS